MFYYRLGINVDKHFKEVIMNLYDKYKAHLQKVADVAFATAVLNWDQEIYMPEKGAEKRAQQISTLSGIVHEMATDKEFGALLEQLLNDPSLDFKEMRNVKESHRVYKDQLKYSTDFVVKMSRTVSEAYQAWHKARTENKFSVFQPLLEKLVELKRQECELLGYDDHPYDALLNQYEPGAKVQALNVLFEDVKKELVPFVKQIASRPQNEQNFLFKHFERQKQWDLGIELLKQMNYDFKAGRQDISAHPFSTSFNSNDSRVTTRINENDLREMIWSCIHEGGHALYEQGLSIEDYGLPSGEAISLGIHESQSRLWENNVGRALPYWKANYAKLQHTFPEQLGDVNLEQFYKAINVVEPSLIRTSADELTYHFHVMIRYEIEKQLIEGKVAVADLPQLWNALYKEYLNIDVPSDAMGVLQDIHWSHGSFGYFPTYSLGSFYAAQFYTKIRQDVPGLEEELEKGNMLPVLQWLRAHVHRYGKTFGAEELCEKITGEKLNFKYFMNYARKKYSYLYNL